MGKSARGTSRAAAGHSMRGVATTNQRASTSLPAPSQRHGECDALIGLIERSSCDGKSKTPDFGYGWIHRVGPDGLRKGSPVEPAGLASSQLGCVGSS